MPRLQGRLKIEEVAERRNLSSEVPSLSFSLPFSPTLTVFFFSLFSSSSSLSPSLSFFLSVCPSSLLGGTVAPSCAWVPCSAVLCCDVLQMQRPGAAPLKAGSSCSFCCCPCPCSRPCSADDAQSAGEPLTCSFHEQPAHKRCPCMRHDNPVAYTLTCLTKTSTLS